MQADGVCGQEDMEQRLEEIANEGENRRPEVGVAKDAEAWRPAEIANEAEVWTPEEAAAKAGGGRPAMSGRPSRAAPYARSATSAVVTYVYCCRTAPFAVAALPLLPRPLSPRCDCARRRR